MGQKLKKIKIRVHIYYMDHFDILGKKHKKFVKKMKAFLPYHTIITENCTYFDI